jgi:ribosomal protein S18 acetylase RimI-like enzyme
MVIAVRKAKKRDRPYLLRLIRNSGAFNNEEKAVAIELVEAALRTKEEDRDYKLLLAEGGRGDIAGYICYGPTPMTEGTWDVYWIIVSPRKRRSGIGKKLLQGAQGEIRARGGRRIIIDTSMQASYRPARALYESCGYRVIATVPNYYKARWHRVTYYMKL